MMSEEMMSVNYMKLKEVLKALGMISDAHLDNQDSIERVLLFELWQILRGDTRDEVSSNDLHTCCMVTMKVPCDKLSHRPRGQEESMDAAFGFIDENNRFKLRIDEQAAFQRHFEPLYLNRVQHLGREVNAKKLANYNHFAFHP